MIISTGKTAVPHLASLLHENAEGIMTCVHCGLCLPSCPTYRLLGNENDSPRGRIYLMRSFVEGRLPMGSSLVTHIDLCLGCRACEPVCPSGVPYGQLLEAARAEIASSPNVRGKPANKVARLMLNKVFTRPRLLAWLLRVVRWFRDTGLPAMAVQSGKVRGRVGFALALLAASRSPVAKTRPNEVPGPSARKTSRSTVGRAALLRGCVMEGLFAPANRATERVLMRNDFELVEAPDQLCCGALHAHSGELSSAREMARRNIVAFEKSGCDVIVTNAAGCGAAMKEYGELLHQDTEYSARAKTFSSRVRDIFELLTERGVQPPRNEVRRRVAYDAPCHLIHAQRVTTAPVTVMESVGCLDMVPLEGFESCCGGAGIYNLQHPDLSSEILAQKIAAIRKSGADTVVTANPGCIMQIGAGAMLAGIDVDVIHPIELLDAGYESLA